MPSGKAYTDTNNARTKAAAVTEKLPNRGPVRGADSGGASRFYPAFRYQAKAPTTERPRLPDGTVHPTVKPVALRRWLVRLLAASGGLVLDPFAGTGTTLEAARLEGFDSMGVEAKAEYAELCHLRLRRDTTRSI
ncbi:DNA methyltransferase [Streptomyces chartreusis]